jgi:type II secretory ATPase GspE/PulE/Tfp pilus assembly ATPase PilB-like protein
MDFPRDLHWAVHPVKLAMLIGLFAGWVACIRWVDEDSQETDMPQAEWNGGMLVGGLVGGLLFLIAPFFLSLPGALASAFAPTFIYAYLRNQKVPPARHVLTPEHLTKVARGLFGMREKKVGCKKNNLPPLRFLGKTLSGGVEDLDAVEKAQQSKGYVAALKLLYDAICQKATDVHLEPREKEMSVRFRVDGLMRGQEPLDRSTGESIINICKVLGALDITEKRKPQDGSFSARYTEENNSEEREIDFRLATAGSLQGEKMVLRLLGRQASLGTLSTLGFTDRMRKQLQTLVHQPHGMILVCGPTGSGKSTTLYACLMEIDRRSRNVITLENPVEFKVPSCTQIEINEKAGKTFAGELRSVLRQDPDVILIGEIRDTETAEIACRAAQTGHLVLSTIHSNDAVTALARLLDLGIPPFLIGNSVVGILAQRLVRKLCEDCKEGYSANPEVVKKLGYDPSQLTTLYKAHEGKSNECPTCKGTGFSGRMGVFEFLPMNDLIKTHLKEEPDMTAIRKEGQKAGMRSLQEDGMRLAAQGITTIQEILRVAQ